MLVALCIVVAATAAVSFTQPLGVYDEGFALTSAWRLLQGEVPHRDYWAAYPAGTSVVMALAFAAFEPTLAVSRAVHVGWSIVLLVSMLAVLRQVVALPRAALATAVAALWVSAAFPASYAMVPALALCMLSLWLRGWARQRGGRHRMALAGAIAGTIMGFRHDLFGYLFIAFALAAVIDYTARRRPPGVRAFDAGTSWFLAAMAAVGAATLGMMVWSAGWQAFIDQAIVFPATGMRANRLLPVPALVSSPATVAWLLAWAGPVATVLLGAASARALWHRGPQTWCLAFVCGALSLLLTLQGHNRMDLSHAAPSVLFVLMLAALAPWTTPGGAVSKLPAATVALALLPMAVLTVLQVLPWIDLKGAGRCLAERRQVACVRTPAEQDEVLAFIERTIPAGEPVLVANSRHDKIFVNDASLYFRMRRPVPVKWHEMHPGVVTTSEVQSAIVKAVESGRIRHVVVAEMPESSEPNASAVSSNVTLLDEHLARHFAPVQRFGRYVVLSRTGP